MQARLKILFLTALLNILLTDVSKSEEINIIVNEQNPVSELSEEQVGNFFLKKVRQWPNGTPVRFFDQFDEKEERKLFLKNFVKKSSREVELYWIGQKLYTGNSAPLQVNSDTIMAGVVARFPGAIGYVSSSFTGAPGVKKVLIRRGFRE